MDKHIFCHWDNVLNKRQIKQTNLICEKHHDQKYKDQAAKSVTKTADIKHIEWKLLKSELQHVVNLWKETNKFMFGFNLFQLSNIDVWNINTYDSKNKGEYNFHYDLTDNYVSDIKLTGIVNISDEPYEGGELIAFYDGEFKEIPQIKNPGSAVLLSQKTLHKVNPVTKGIRKTLSVWYCGPKFI